LDKLLKIKNATGCKINRFKKRGLFTPFAVLYIITFKRWVIVHGMQPSSQIIEAIENLDVRLRTFFDSEINLAHADNILSTVEHELQNIMEAIHAGSPSCKDQTKPAIEVLLQTLEKGRTRLRARINELEHNMKEAQHAKTALHTYATHMHGSPRS
jgi:exonuclease VII small subunit